MGKRSGKREVSLYFLRPFCFPNAIKFSFFFYFWKKFFKIVAAFRKVYIDDYYKLRRRYWQASGRKPAARNKKKAARFARLLGGFALRGALGCVFCGVDGGGRRNRRAASEPKDREER